MGTGVWRWQWRWHKLWVALALALALALAPALAMVTRHLVAPALYVYYAPKSHAKLPTPRLELPSIKRNDPCLFLVFLLH